MTARSIHSRRPAWLRFSLAAFAVGAVLAGPVALEAAPKRTKKPTVVASTTKKTKTKAARAATAEQAPAAEAADRGEARETEPAQSQPVETPAETSPEAAEAAKAKRWKAQAAERADAPREQRDGAAVPEATAASGATPAAASGSAASASPVIEAAPAAQASISVGSMNLQDRFAGSAFLVFTSANLNTFAPALQLTQNPTVGTLFMVVPRFVVNKDLAVRARLGLDVEWTNSDWTTRLQEPLLTDLLFDVRYGALPTFLGGTKATLLGSVVVPTSKASLADTLIMAPGVGVELAHGFDRVLSGSVLLVAVAGYRHSFFSSQTPRVRADRPYDPQCYGNGPGCFAQLGGAGNVHDSLSWTLGAFGQWGIVSPSLTFQVAHQFPFQFSEQPGIERDETRPNARVFSNVSLAVDVRLTEFMSGGIGYSMGRNVIAGDGQLGNPFFDRNQDMRLTLSLSIALPGFGGTGRR